MSLKDLNLATKIGFGFAVVLLLLVGVGGLAIFRMSEVGRNSQNLSDVKIPEVTIASGLESDILETFFHMRGYGYTLDPQFLASGRTFLEKAIIGAASATNLVTKVGSESLGDLKELGEKGTEQLQQYEVLINETVTLNEARVTIKASIDSAMTGMQEACGKYQQDQLSALAKEIGTLTDTARLVERAQKLDTLSKLTDLIDEAIITVWKGQAQRKTDVIEQSIVPLKEAESILEGLRPITRQEVNIENINKCVAQIAIFRKAAADLSTSMKKGDSLTTQRQDLADGVKEVAARTSDKGMAAMAKMGKESADNLSNASTMVTIGLVIALLIGMIFAVALTRMIVRPIKKGVDFAAIIADGDLTQRIDLNQKDEVGVLAASLNTMSEHLRKSFSEVAAHTESVASASEELTAVSNELAANAEETQAQAAHVATSTEQMSASIHNVAAATEEMSVSMETVSASVEEINASLSEVAKNCSEGSRISLDADRQAVDAKTAMQSLAQSASDIGNVIETISSIAKQTNLLALNATIEAARAGEAGKGFAVVASEVKELANQTGRATEEIGSRIQAMQTDTRNASGIIEKTTEIIGRMSNISQTIAAAVEEQSVTTSEISQTVQGVSAAAKEVARNIQETSMVTNDISSVIQGVNQAAGGTASAATESSASAKELAEMAMRLRGIVGRFKV